MTASWRRSAIVAKDECNRPDTTIEALAKLPPVFDTTSGRGSVTAGNSSQLSDGASATLVMSMERANALELTPLLVFRGYAVSGCAPDEMGIGPVFAVPKLLKHAGVKVDDVDIWELNEAFASQVIYCRDQLGIPMEKLNPNGGSIAIGHPFGMTGSRLVGTIANEMARRKARYGVVTMCVGGGPGRGGVVREGMTCEGSDRRTRTSVSVTSLQSADPRSRSRTSRSSTRRRARRQPT